MKPEFRFNHNQGYQWYHKVASNHTIQVTLKQRRRMTTTNSPNH